MRHRVPKYGDKTSLSLSPLPVLGRIRHWPKLSEMRPATGQPSVLQPTTEAAVNATQPPSNILLHPLGSVGPTSINKANFTPPTRTRLRRRSVCSPDPVGSILCSLQVSVISRYASSKKQPSDHFQASHAAAAATLHKASWMHIYTVSHKMHKLWNGRAQTKL